MRIVEREIAAERALITHADICDLRFGVSEGRRMFPN